MSSRPSAARLLPVIAVAAIAAGAGYWAGQRTPGAPAGSATPAPAGQARQVLYYRNPMGLPDTSPVPKKDPMGMDYIPVYAGEEPAAEGAAGSLRISPEKVQKLGVRSEAARLENLGGTVRAAGRIEANEGRSYAIAPKFEGYVERLHVNATGQAVAKGQPLFEVYSPELVSAQREYAIAAQGVDALKSAGGEAQAGMQQLAEASLARLRNWDVPEAQVKALAKSGAARRSLTFHSPVSGVVTEKKAVQGMRFGPGEALYQIADLSSVWVMADVFEQDIRRVKVGSPAQVTVDAYPEEPFTGKVAYVYPTLRPETRSVQVRIELANPRLLLKPGMFAQVTLEEPHGAGAVVTVPNSAVIDSGRRRIVLVQIGEGRFEPREVQLGRRSDERVQVLAGVKEGEPVVVAANFLIDAESNLKAALGAMTAADAGSAARPGSKAAAGVGHQADGKVEEVDAQSGSVSISHGPVASLKWPAMTMEFKAANSALLQQLKPGVVVRFEFVERGQGEWVITAVTPQATSPAAAVADHSAHGKH
ncbi:cation efflux system protein [Azospira sp. I13]|uniref:efflux RND transporter periplasmic adaptor subunit n=1 Tax=Azospira sp. I13 TaxID=1765050 RepID=UPI000D4C13AA|nr:efflux RND transporter periplasmic adaptor subunit [Azospira sp. I13]GBG03248.1 cation efflux system protein [Azospira sp. I13]